MAKQKYKTRFLNACRDLIKLYQNEDYTPEFKKGKICDIYLGVGGCICCPFFTYTQENRLNWKTWCKNHFTYPKTKDSDKSARIEFLEMLIKKVKSLRDYHFTPSYLGDGGLKMLRRMVLKSDKAVHNRRRENKWK